ncbi:MULTISPECIES: MarR family winged helix-turn-helix transcriptional regulator [Saccharopolyspora]|uniref:MarR family winged helix-turn-helix transcriptional regulator n=1 Tax=Saccharopolyspora TaxID=1835 RepID=UPI001CD659B4|nr:MULTISPECIES: MarR family winged helix-turn-helix transcriptional regulator [Saccharopolyspora]MCA1189938.1 MarR family winged helix-turn-helix transcriptional regulator [Saccharopolyspora sp. 6T]MCA1228122.1 MarR family winged helix-turn-helix transcriptional regulator [Saccharopolyspora sp. 6M]MCA1278255.1 MarR family winged helix-turn-helix transcriptional regulator [Saccharopolyspora sp. 7B]
MSDKLARRQHVVKSGDQACDAYAALVDQVGRLADVVEAVGNGIARPTGQSLARWQVLAEVEHEAAPVGAIACRLGHTRQGVQRVADLLVEDGLACYRPNPAHQRAKLLEVTPTGRAALHRMQAAYTHLALRTTEGLDPERLDLARETLGELQRRLESELP